MKFPANTELVHPTRRGAVALGVALVLRIRNYLVRLPGVSRTAKDAADFERLSRLAKGNSNGWKFNREELHQQFAATTQP